MCLLKTFINIKDVFGLCFLNTLFLIYSILRFIYLLVRFIGINMCVCVYMCLICLLFLFYMIPLCFSLYLFIPLLRNSWIILFLFHYKQYYNQYPSVSFLIHTIGFANYIILDTELLCHSTWAS